MKFILGTKQYMTQIFDERGRALPATVIAAQANRVTRVKTKDGADRYDAVQIALPGRKGKLTKRERRGAAGDLKDGDEVAVSVFAPGERVSVHGLNKAKGFQGAVKRHGFKGGPRSHGQKHSERAPGSLGAGGVQRVFKGMRMAGRMGGTRTTVKNLTVLRVDADAGELYLQGAVPGRRGTLIEIHGK